MTRFSKIILRAFIYIIYNYKLLDKIVDYKYNHIVVLAYQLYLAVGKGYFRSVRYMFPFGDHFELPTVAICLATESYFVNPDIHVHLVKEMEIVTRIICSKY
ncbi:hypothetical protein ACJX0J_025588 [Zea mays]